MATSTGNLGGGAAVPYASASLYVGDLQPDVTEALLFEIFNAVGPVVSVRVCRDAATRRSLGYAYVNFHRVDDAERALDTMNFKNIRNRPCRIMWSHRDPSLRKSGLGNIFVNHLAKSIDNKQLYDTFSMFGNILSCKVCINQKRESLGYGFVHYESEEAAAAAIARVDGKVIAGSKVSVSVFKSKKERGGTNKFKYTNVFIKNLPPEVTKEQVEEVFSKWGTITSCVITLDKESKTRAFGFVNYAAPEEATAAVENGNNLEFQGRKLFVGRAQKKEEREKELRERFEALKLDRQKKYAGVNLYVKNLSDEMDDSRLTTEFSKYGSITSAKIMKDSAGKSRGFGFVCFSSPEEATKAVTELNGKMLDNKPLYVALAQRKDLRRQQLEAQYATRAKMGGAVGVGAMGPMGGMGNPMANPGLAQQQAAAAAAAMTLPYAMPQNPMFPSQMPPNRQFLYNGLNPMMNPAAAMNMGAMRGMPGQWNPAVAAAAAAQMNGAGLNRAPMAGGAIGGMNPAFAGMPGLNQNPALNQQGRPGQPGMPQPGNLLSPLQQVPQQRGPGQGQGPPGQVNGRGPRGGPGAQPPQPGQQQGQGQGPRPGGQPQGISPAQAKMMNLPPHLLAQQQQAQQQQQQQQVQQQQQAAQQNALRAQYPNAVPQAVRPPQQQQQVQPQPNEMQLPMPTEQLTIKALAAAPEEMRKQMIGERLFPMIKMQEPLLAGKITGMLLEMDNGELIHLIESQPALNEKIAEALQVLQQHPGIEQQEGEDGETDK